MSLEKKINKITRSFLAGAVLATHLFTSACTSSREYLGKQWEPSILGAKEEVLDSRIKDEEKKVYQLEDITIDYDNRTIEVLVNEEIIKYTTKTEEIKVTKFEEEVQEGRVRETEMGDKSDCKKASMFAGIYGGLLGTPLLIMAGKSNNPFGWMMVGLWGASEIVGFFALGGYGCFPESRTHDTKSYTGKNRSLESTYEKKTELPPEVLQSLPVEKGYIKVEGEIVEGKYQVSKGMARFKVSPAYPLLFTPDEGSIKSRADLSWLGHQCRDKPLGLYITKHAKKSSTKLNITIEGSEGYAPAEKTYTLPVFWGPSKEKVENFCEE